MQYRAVFAAMLLWPGPAMAESDEISPVPVPAVMGHAYFGDAAPSRIRFVNVRARPVRIVWVAFDGTEHPYGRLDPGSELIQPTFVAHRWVVKDEDDGTPLQAFISTRATLHDDGIPQIALIR